MDKIWLKSYQSSVPKEINTDQYESLVDLFEQSCCNYAAKVAYVNLGHSLTYAALDQKSKALATYLQQLGLKQGARVAIMMPNALQYPVALFAILRAGYVVVNTNPHYTVDEVTEQMKSSGAEAIIVLANFAHVVEKALPQTLIKHVIVTQIADMLPFVERVLVNGFIRYAKRMVPPYHLPEAIRFNDALKRGSMGTFKPVTLDRQSIAFLQYTGGTTGVAKGAILTHGNMIANVLQAYAWVSSLVDKHDDIVITALPLYHIFSLTANCLLFLKVGAKNILITNPRNVSHFVKAIKNSHFTAITGVNTLFNALLHHPKFNEIDCSKLKLALAGGMSLQKRVAEKWKEKTNTRILEAYGLTETSPAVTINPLYLDTFNGSIGLPLPSTEIAIRDEGGHDLPIGGVGELCVKGPQVMAGYWQRSDETALVFTQDGFLKTGDIARVDEQGFVYLVDRKKDMIDVSGFNVYPNEVEHVISMHPGVLEVGVVGVVDSESGERVKACIVKRDPNLTVEDVVTHCRQHLTAYKIPKTVMFYEELPKTNVGKILRRALKDIEEKSEMSNT